MVKKYLYTITLFSSLVISIVYTLDITLVNTLAILIIVFAIVKLTDNLVLSDSQRLHGA